MFKSLKDIQSKYNIKGGNFMNLEEGSNKVRIVSDFVDYGIHKVEDENGKYKSVICIGKDNNCPYCAQHIPVRVQFLGWVIDRKDKQIKLLRIGYEIYKQLSDYKDSEEYHFEGLPPYDIEIIRTGKGLDTAYNVIPSRKDTPLTKEEEEQISKTIKDPQEIIEKMKDKVMLSLEDSLNSESREPIGEEIDKEIDEENKEDSVF